MVINLFKGLTKPQKIWPQCCFVVATITMLKIDHGALQTYQYESEAFAGGVGEPARTRKFRARKTSIPIASQKPVTSGRKTLSAFA